MQALTEGRRWGLDLSCCHTSNQFWHLRHSHWKIQVAWICHNLRLIHKNEPFVGLDIGKSSRGWSLIVSVCQSTKHFWRLTSSLHLPTAPLFNTPETPNLEALVEFRRNQFCTAALSLGQQPVFQLTVWPNSIVFTENHFFSAFRMCSGCHTGNQRQENVNKKVH